MKPSAVNRPNIILVLFDSMRKHNVSCYGYDQETTPALDRLSQQGVRFTQAFAPAPFTVASTASMLTGVYPSVHQLEYAGQRLAENLVSLPQVLQKAGYFTAGFVANPHVNPDSGMTRGFTHFTDGRPGYKRLPVLKRLSAWAESGKSLNHSVKKVLQANPNRPFFFFVFYNDSHIPFSPLPRIFLPLAGKKYHSPDFERLVYSDEELAKVVRLYNQALQRADQRLAELLQIIQQSPYSDNTSWIVSADHGEGLDRRLERAGHGRLYDHGIHVPLVVCSPALPAPGRVSSALVSGLDLAPTICEWAGIEPPRHWQGSSLVPQVDRSHVISEYHDSRAVRTESWKTIFRGSGISARDMRPGQAAELYDLKHDPEEAVNVIADYPAVAAQHTQILSEFLAPLSKDRYDPSTFQVEDILLERLRGLGYVE